MDAPLTVSHLNRPPASVLGVRESFAGKLPLLALLAGCLVLSGCGSKNAGITSDERPATESIEQSEPKILAPAEIVSQFLDRVRRGGEGDSASDLLSKLAQQEMTRIGRPLQFPGSPDTTFEVRPAIPVPSQGGSVPSQEGLVWVHTFLSESGESGETTQYEAVWTLRQESAGWRIAGVAIDQGDNLEPLQIDFEDGDQMEARLAAMEATDDVSPR